MKNKEDLIWAGSIIKDFLENVKYGEVTIKFEAGKIVHLKDTVTRKPPKKN